VSIISDNRKYYYLKLKNDFFDSETLVILESMPDGYLYSNILLKLYLRSLKNEGKLIFNDRIPYNSTILAQITRHNVGVIEKALKIFQDLGLVEILDNGAIYLLDIQNFIGKSTTEADRKREYRARIDDEREGKIAIDGQMSDKCLDKSPPEIEIELDKELELEKDIKIKYAEFVSMREKDYNTLIEKHGEDTTKEMIEVLDNYKGSKGATYKNDYRAILSWVVSKVIKEGNRGATKGHSTKNNEPEDKWNVEHLINRA